MPKLSAQPDDVHSIREVHLHYGHADRLPAPLKDSEDVANFLREMVKDTTREHAVAIYLDPKNRPLGWRIVSIGTDVMAPVKPLLVLQPAVLLGANAMIFAQSSLGRSRTKRRRQEVGRDALRSLYAAWAPACRQHHLDRGG